MTSFKKWAHKLLRRQEPKKAQAQEIPPPVLLSPSRQSLSLEIAPNEYSDATSKSPFFTRLPPEIRIRMYSYFFLEERIHLELYYGHRYESNNDFSIHAQMSIDPLTGQRLVDYNTEKTWRWWSCVCHGHDLIANGRREDGVYNETDFRDDGCLRGKCGTPMFYYEPQHCIDGKKWGLSWILTCKQAYTECIDLLYANKFSLGTVKINEDHRNGRDRGANTCSIVFLPLAFPLRRLQNITGLSIDWELSQSFKDEKGWYGLAELFTSILPKFTALKTLHVQIRYVYFKGAYDLVFQELLVTTEPLEALRRKGETFDRVWESMETLLFTAVDSYVVSHSANRLKDCRIVLGAYLFPSFVIISRSPSRKGNMVKKEYRRGKQIRTTLGHGRLSTEYYREVESPEGLKKGYWISDCEDKPIQLPPLVE